MSSAPKRKPTCPTEHQEQTVLCEWFHYQYPLLRGCLFAIPNGGERNAIVAAKIKAEGVTPGVFDLFLMQPAGQWHGLFVEMKRQRGATVGEHQHRFKELATKQGYCAVVCYGARDAGEQIRLYLNGV